MNILEQAKHLPHGAEVILEWLGQDGLVVEPEVSQKRADICQNCPMNERSPWITQAIAFAVKRHLSVKNQLNLRVKGEKGLGTCKACGCQLRLLVHEPDQRVARSITEEERKQLPSYCWKLKL